jgi:S-layer homology domain
MRNFRLADRPQNGTPKEVPVISPRRIAVSLLCALMSAAAASAQHRTFAKPLATTSQKPDAFGTTSYTVTTISAVAFHPDNHINLNAFYDTSAGDLGRFGDSNQVTEFYGTLDLPGGAVIDYIGLNTSTDADGAYGVNLISRHKDGSSISIGTFSSAVHGWATDFNSSPIGYVWQGLSGDALIINVEEGFNANPELFGSVEVWWHRSVSPPPASASFNDVPTTHPFFQFVEALKASGVTGGCSANPPLYCPDSPLTRGQMAVFLAKALGLSWSGN